MENASWPQDFSFDRERTGALSENCTNRVPEGEAPCRWRIEKYRDKGYHLDYTIKFKPCELPKGSAEICCANSF